MFMYSLLPTENALSRMHGRSAPTKAKGRHARWYPLLMLVWSIWLFITPLYEPQYFPRWLWPTVGSYAVFLVLFYRAFYRDRRHMLSNALGVAALAFLLVPFNPGGQTYIIYACAFLAFSGPVRTALAWMLGLLIAHTIQWTLLGWPLIYLVSTVMVGLAVGLMNISFARKAQADAALLLSHEEVRRLAALAERERIGRDLHDLLGHTLSLVALKSDLAGRLLERDPAGARREIDEVSRVARDALAQVRRAVTGIRAAGLAAELASAKLLLESDGIALTYPPAIPPLPPDVETALALTLREAVTNLQRHSRARAARIGLEIVHDRVVLSVEDNGLGTAIVPGNGLCGMRERLEALAGGLRIDAVSGRGTRLEACLPLPQSSAEHTAAPAAIGPDDALSPTRAC